MSHEDVLKVLGDIAAADGATYAIVGILTLVAVIVMRVMLPLKGLVFVFAPAIFWGGLMAVYGASSMGFSFHTDKAAHIAAASAIGATGGFLVMVLFARLVEAATRIRTPLTEGAPVPVPRRVRV